MIWGNALIFIVTIVIVCLVDFSTIALDEPTERLLYYEDEQSEAEESNAEEINAEESNADTTSETPEQKDKSSESAESTAPENSKSSSEAKKSKKSKKQKEKEKTVVEDEVGMNIDFQDDFMEIDSSIDEIYERGDSY